jgi:hypothetical protein
MKKSVNVDLGIVSAYGEALSAGFKGTREEFAQMLANLREVHAECVAANDSALDAATRAASSEATAVASAGTASASAQAAATSETNADASETAAAASARASAASATAAAASEQNAAASETSAAASAQEAREMRDAAAGYAGAATMGFMVDGDGDVCVFYKPDNEEDTTNG